VVSGVALRQLMKRQAEPGTSDKSCVRADAHTTYAAVRTLLPASRRSAPRLLYSQACCRVDRQLDCVCECHGTNVSSCRSTQCSR